MGAGDIGATGCKLYRCSHPIPDELGLGPLPGPGIDERGHADRDPVGLQAPCAAQAMARRGIFEPALAIRPPHIPRLRPLVGCFPFLERIPQDFNHTTLRPLPW